MARCAVTGSSAGQHSNSTHRFFCFRETCCCWNRNDTALSSNSAFVSAPHTISGVRYLVRPEKRPRPKMDGSVRSGPRSWSRVL